jgi:hypothetical protein
MCTSRGWLNKHSMEAMSGPNSSLSAAEAGMPYLYVDKLSIQSPEVFGEPESGRMRMTIGVVGQWQSSD